MVNYLDIRDWKQSFLNVIPARKVASNEKDSDSSSDRGQDTHSEATKTKNKNEDEIQGTSGLITMDS
jgi:hypothetical protein